jgi:hypothetical protein
MPRSASVGGLAKRGVIPRKQFYTKLFFFNTVILEMFHNYSGKVRLVITDVESHGRKILQSPW